MLHHKCKKYTLILAPFFSCLRKINLNKVKHFTNFNQFKIGLENIFQCFLVGNKNYSRFFLVSNFYLWSRFLHKLRKCYERAHSGFPSYYLYAL